MDNEQIKKEILEINSKIEKLQSEKEELEKQLISQGSSFEENFLNWVNSDLGEELDWIPDKTELPHIRNYIDKYLDLERYRTYDLVEIFEEFIYYIENPEELKDDEYISTERFEEFKLVAAEMMEENVKSFTCDW